MGSMSESLKKVYMEKYGRVKWNQRNKIVEIIWEEIKKKISLLHLDYAKVKIFQDGLPKCGRELEIAKSAADGGSKNYQLLLHLVEKGAHLIGTEDPDLLIQEYNKLRDTLDTLKISRRVPMPLYGSAFKNPARWTPGLIGAESRKRDRPENGKNGIVPKALTGLQKKGKLLKARSALIKNGSLGFVRNGTLSSSNETFVSQRDKYMALRIDETLREGETALLFVGVVHRVNELLPSDIKISYLLPI
jgi:hypothetical protein